MCTHDLDRVRRHISKDDYEGGSKGWISWKNPRGQGSDSISEAAMKLSRKDLSEDVEGSSRDWATGRGSVSGA